jgi:hypothetical protein
MVFDFTAKWMGIDQVEGDADIVRDSCLELHAIFRSIMLHSMSSYTTHKLSLII